MAKRKLNIQVGEYDRRGVGLGKELIEKSKIMRHIIQYAQDESHGLDIQLRGGYMNIYYQGGNLVRLSEKSCWFDKNYLYLPEENGLRMTDIERLCREDYIEKAKGSKILKHKSKEELRALRQQAKVLQDTIVGERKSLVNRLKNSDSTEEVSEVIEDMKKKMRKWKKRQVDLRIRKEIVGERTVQHYISLYNKKFDDQTDFVVLDIEYAISTNALYAKEIEPEKQPRIDIVAIEKGTGQVYVMELKYGKKSIGGNASAEKHYDDYLLTVGHEDKWRAFIADIKELLQAKKDLKIIDKDIQIRDCKPMFAFVLKSEKDDDADYFRQHIEGKEKTRKIPTLYLPVEPDYNSPSAERHKLKLSKMK